MKKFFKKLARRFRGDDVAPPAPVQAPSVLGMIHTAAPVTAKEPQPGERYETHVSGQYESLGPGKNVFVPKVAADRELDSSDILEILDNPSLNIAADDDADFDPYNTGRFDVSKSWQNVSKKR